MKPLRVVHSSGIESFSAVRSGDKNAFEMMFKSYYQPLCRYANTFVNDPEEAEEIVQGSFINIWEKRLAIDINTSVKAYLYRAIRNACLNALKHQKVKHLYAQNEVHTGERYFEASDESTLRDELETRIRKAIQVLPEQCRVIFQLSRFEELKYQEIADQLNLSVKTVENQMGKALKIMREQLRDYLPLIALMMNGLLDQ
ncbi:MAG: RNA polymerase sigma-70 factor [Cyclobacteriaceae bacterium]|nr:RNA polymerase sigma-70 factor [Cyclobacteriaceae bacterium]UYN87737.1 MAG: RNA polymerase sigma-70 factor [Cyclobacteriaceae bacterium]